VYCLARDCAGDRIVRKFVAPALELIMLDKALNNEFDRESQAPLRRDVRNCSCGRRPRGAG